jgi:D-tyrosyl-tRNA(Tyr) deacylase
VRAVVQRVSHGKVTVDGRSVAEIGLGLVILLGVGPQDGRAQAESLAHKIAMLRIFQDEQGKMNLSVLDVSGGAIVVSQFTLYADTRKGHRPSFTEAAPPAIASPLCDYFVECLKSQRVPAQSGEFGAHMLVDIANDGPVTISLEV